MHIRGCLSVLRNGCRVSQLQSGFSGFCRFYRLNTDDSSSHSGYLQYAGFFFACFLLNLSGCCHASHDVSHDDMLAELCARVDDDYRRWGLLEGCAALLPSAATVLFGNKRGLCSCGYPPTPHLCVPQLVYVDAQG